MVLIKYLVMVVMIDKSTINKLLNITDWSSTEFNLFGKVSDPIVAVGSVVHPVVKTFFQKF